MNKIAEVSALVLTFGMLGFIAHETNTFNMAPAHPPVVDKSTITNGLFDPEVLPPKIIKTGEHEYHVYITDEIASANLYDDLRIDLAAATDQDTYVFELTSPGGSVATMHALIDSIHGTSAHTIANVHGMAASAAAMIAVACNQINMSEGSTLMFHNIQVSLQGDGVQSQKRLEEGLRESNIFITKELSNFLTPEELSTVINGGEVWLGKGEVDERSEHRTEIVSHNIA